MTNVYLLVEGQTEAAFTQEVLIPYYRNTGLYFFPTIIRTRPGHKGGVATYGKIKRELDRLCKEHPKEHVSTMFDLYALPKDFPGKDRPDYRRQTSGQQKARFLEAALDDDIRHNNFIPNLLVHEFETLLFTRVEAFEEWRAESENLESLYAIRASTAPEDINDHPDTAPSKRILDVMPRYDKAFHGPLIADAITLDAIRRACPHFDGWLKKLEGLPSVS